MKKQKEENEERKEIRPKIECNVVDCTHNCIEDSTCRLDTIRVCNSSSNKYAKDKEATSCSSFKYVGDLNEEGISGRD